MSDTGRLTDLFLPHLAPAAAARAREPEPRLEQLLEEARSAWPEILLAPEVFLPYLAARVPEHWTGEWPLDLRIADLYLACACAEGIPAALAAFHSRYSEVVDSTLRRLRVEELGQDARQAVSQRLFVGDGERQPKILLYSGEGELAHWLRVTVLRQGLNLLRKEGRQVLDDHGDLVDRVVADDDLELQYMKRLYREAFRRAFHEALATLEVRERNILRQHVLDGMTFEQMGRLYGVHRATVCRWMSAVHQKLLAGTRRKLTERLEVGRDELDSIMALIESRLDITLQSALREVPEPD